MKQIVLLLIISGTFITSYSQTIKGKAVDPIDNKPLAGATLTLTSVKDSMNRYSAVADSSGTFRFQNLPVDSFFLKLSFINYEEYKQIVSTSDSIPVNDLGTLFVPKKTTELTGVTLTTKTPPVQQKGDTTQFNASQYKVNPDANTEDLIKKMPGITVDKDGTVTAQGEQVRKVTVDGREFFGDDATAALRNLPAEVIDKIQVFDRLSDQAQFTGFDDGNSQKAINIVTKSGIKNGQFGRIYGGYGTDDRYAAGGNVSFFKGDRRLSFVGNFNNVNQQNFASQDLLGVTNTGGNNRGGGGNFGGANRGGQPNRGGGGGNFGGANNFSVGQQSGISKTNAIGINYGDKWGRKIDVTGSYFFNNSGNVNDYSSSAQFVETDRVDNNVTLSNSKNYNHRFNLRLEYRIDSLNSLIVSPSLNFQKNSSYSNSYANTLDGVDSVNSQLQTSDVVRNGYNLRNNILYRHSFASNRRRTLSIGFEQTFNKNDGTSYVYALNRIFKNNNYDDSLQNQYIDNPTNGYALSGNIAYTEPLGQKSQLQINYQPSYSKSKADQQTFNYDDLVKEYSEFVPTLSNKFENTTITHNGGVTYRLNANRDNQFSAGVSFQYSHLQSDRIYPSVAKVDQSFNNLLPNLMWRKKISARSSLNIFYRTRTQFPTVTQLQDVVNSSNMLRLRVGNPELQQSYTHFLSARYTFTNTQKGQSFFANVFYSAQQNYISNGTYIATMDSIIQHGIVLDSGSQLTKPVNLNGYQSLNTFFTFSQPVKFLKSNVSLSTGFSYSKLPALFNYQKSFTDNYTYNAGIVIASNVSEYIDFNLSYNINFNNAVSSTGSQDNKYINQMAGIQFNLLTKNGWFVQNDINNQTYSGLGEGYDQSFWLWNAGIGKKFLKNKEAELKLSVFDLLKQNRSITREVTPTQIIDSETKVLRQYFMLTFTYSLKNFGTPTRSSGQQRRPAGDRF